MSFNSAAATIIQATGTGLNGNGAIYIPGLRVGDVLFEIFPSEAFEYGIERIVSVNDHLQQTSPLDWSGVNFTFYLLRGV